MVMYTWWCWHICKGEEVRVDTDQLGEEKEAKGGHYEWPDADRHAQSVAAVERAVLILWPDASAKSNRMHRACVG